ncbi:toxin-antitoxin system toxin subunit [Streptomyces piniterrae]|uniref:Toxin-antitoxin system toxin subunit n=1 Tax=Streptomyces piniterrae TaxID=2571125 RepID=A0A4U0NVV9_9ACTN|nr:SRPBCC family protein [Streptomyces piniterrae]TJZ58839.1 toxin-antitoxin system toxin subunit [Streptomyces piniterrae]
MNPHSDTLITADGRTALRMERRLAHPPHKVWSAITDPAQIGRWFPSEVTVELVPGGAMTFSMPGAAGAPMTGTVTAADEPRLFAFTWGEDHLSWEITPDGDGSLLTFVHTFGDRFGGASFASGWHLCITALAQLLDGEPTAVTPDTGELHEAYLEQFDLGQGAVEETSDGPLIRFERQLVRPAEAVWAELTRGDEPRPGSPVPAGFAAEKIPNGPVTEVRAPTVLAYRWHPEGTVRWELGRGTGHGARLVLTQTGPRDFDAESALAAWHSRIEHLAARLLES